MRALRLLSRKCFAFFVIAGFFYIARSPIFSAVDLTPEQEITAAKELLDKYIQAFQMRNLALASEVYAHDSDLIVYGSSPSDRRLGWAETEEYLRKYFAAVDRIEIALQERSIKFHKSGDVSWFAQVLRWTETEKGKTYTMEGLRITGVLEKRDRGWVIVQLHASGPPPTS